MSTTKQVAIKDVKPYALMVSPINAEHVIAVSDVWDQTDSSMGIVVKGQTVEKVHEWSHRFMNPDEKVTIITGSGTDE